MKITVFILLILITCSLQAQTYYLNVWSKGKVVSIPVDEIRKLTFAGITGVGETGKMKTIIKNFELFQNYPNPFNPSTRIEYQIPGTGTVKIQIYNTNGQLVRTLEDGSRPAGKYSVDWDGRCSNSAPAASGIYICRVIYGSSALSKKMILLK